MPSCEQILTLAPYDSNMREMTMSPIEQLSCNGVNPAFS